MNFTEENTTETFKPYLKGKIETVQQKALRVLKGFHNIGVDKEIKTSNFKGKYGKLNAEVYLLNTGYN